MPHYLAIISALPAMAGSAVGNSPNEAPSTHTTKPKGGISSLDDGSRMDTFLPRHMLTMIADVLYLK